MLAMKRFYVLLLISCAIFWVGISANASPIPAEIAQRGQPNVVIHLPNGNTQYIYSVQAFKNYTPPNMSNPTVIVAPDGRAIGANIAPPEPIVIPRKQCTTTYEVDRQGRVVSVWNEGNIC